MNRIPTGLDGLDSVLYGGLPEFSNILIGGAPGTGKTILTQNLLFNINRATGRNVIYFTTVNEPQIKVLRYQQQFSFFNAESFMESVIFQDLGSLIREKRLKDGLAAINNVVLKYNPIVIAIDSFKAIADFMPSKASFREFISELSIHLSIWECTVLLTGEYLENELKTRQEAALVDGILYLYGTEEQKFQKRYLRVLKMRGTNFLPGEHVLQINQHGVRVFPRLTPEVQKQPFVFDKRRQSTGLTDLDNMLGGGLPTGTTTLISGCSGTGKSLLGLNWLMNGVQHNEPGMLVTFEQYPEQIINNARSFGYRLDEMIQHNLLHILHVSPVELDVDFHMAKIQNMVVEKKIKRLLIDSISAFEIGMADKYKFTDYIWGLTNYFKSQGISVVLINEIPELFHAHQLSKHGISFIADNIIVTQLVQKHFTLRRLLGVIKVRGSHCSTEMKELVLDDDGPVLIEADWPGNGILSKEEAAPTCTNRDDDHPARQGGQQK